MNIPNIISLSRIPILFLVVGLLYLPIKGAATLAFLLFIIGAVSDLVDGYIARKYNIVSTLGKFIDALTDKIFVVGLFVTLLAFGFLPEGAIVLILLIIGREFLVTGLRLVAASKGIVLAAEKMGKIKTCSQVFTIGAYLFGNVIQSDFSQWLLPWMVPLIEAVGLVSFLLATYLTVSSGVGYIVKYWSLLTEEGIK